MHNCRELDPAGLLHGQPPCAATGSLCVTKHPYPCMPFLLRCLRAWQVDAERRVARLLAAEQAILDKCFPRHGRYYTNSPCHQSTRHGEGSAGHQKDSARGLPSAPITEYVRVTKVRACCPSLAVSTSLVQALRACGYPTLPC